MCSTGDLADFQFKTKVMADNHFPLNFCNDDDFHRYFKKYAEIIYNYVLRRTADSSRAKDITECIFITLHANCARIKSEEHLRGFLYRTADNLVAKFRHNDAQRRERDADIAYHLGMEHSLMSNPDHAEHQVLSLLKAIQVLPECKQHIVFLRFFRNIPVVEIAIQLGIEPQTVRNHLSQSIEILKNELLGGNGKKYPGFS